MLLPPGAESHSYEPSPRDIIKIQNSDIFIFTGGESDMWIEDILESMDTKDMKIIRLMECVNSLEEELSEGMVGHEIHNHEKEYDEHVWTSPENAIVITNKISEVIRELDSENSEYYEENTKRYVGELTALSQEFRDVVKEGSRNVVVFGDRFPFRYFTEEYGLEYFAAFPGCSSETEPSVSTLVFLIDMVKKEDIPVIFYLEASNRKTAEMISEATGAKPLLFHSCHSLYQKELDEGRTYLDLMKQNAENLREALQ